ncbi:MAG: hypothetical protein Q9173_005825, partial [Seirophora scorigena]
MPPPTSSQSWQDYRDLIQQLYVDEERSLPNVIEEVERLTGFCATERQYKRRISAWSLDKNIKNDEMKAIIAMEAIRLRKGKQSLFYVRGRQVDPKKITRFARRKNINRNQDDEANPDHRLPPQTIRCITPPPDVEQARAPPLQSKRTHDSQPRENDMMTAPAHSDNSEDVQKDILTPPNKRLKTVEVTHQPSLSELNQARILKHATPLSAFPQGLQASNGTNGSQPSSGTVINASAYHEAMPKPPDININFSPPHKPLDNEDHSTSNATGQLSVGGYNRASMLLSDPLGSAISNGPAVDFGGDSGLLPVSYPTSSLRTGLTPGEGDGPISATDRSPTPKLNPTISNIYQDELYYPLERLQQQLPQDHPHSAKRNPALDELLRAVHGRYDLYQAVSDQDSSARSSSPSRATYGTRERSPFLPGSRFLPENESHSFELGTISPKEASLDDIPTEDDSPLPLFNQVTRHQSHRHK